MHINLTETELANKISTLVPWKSNDYSKVVDYLMEEGLTLNPEDHEYEVSLIFEVDAKNPEDAVRATIEAMGDDTTLWDFEYQVTDINTGLDYAIAAYTLTEDAPEKPLARWEEDDIRNGRFLR